MTDYWPEEEAPSGAAPYSDEFEDPGGVIRDCFGLVAYGVPDGTTMIADIPWYPDLQLSALDLLRRRAPKEAARIERLATRRAARAGSPWVVVDILD
jgi:hypothetical protein